MFFDIAVVFSVLLAFGFALLHVLLVSGAPLGSYVLGGKHRVLPPRMRIASGFFAFVFAIVGIAFLQKGGAISEIFLASFVHVLLIIYTLFLAYAIIGNGFITKSKKEKIVMTPLSILGFASGVLVLFH